MNSRRRGKTYIPYSSITSFPPVEISRTCVRVYKTVYGEPYFVVEGSARNGKDWYPLTEDMPDADRAWEKKLAIDKEIAGQ